MSLSSSFIHLSSPFKSQHPSPFLHGSLPPLFSLPKTSAPVPLPSASPSSLTVRAMKIIQGCVVCATRMVCATNVKMLAVEVVRLAPHPKCKRHIRIKKMFQAHDLDNQFKVGDYVQLQKSRPISKTKTFIAVPVTASNTPKSTEPVPLDLDIPL